MEFPAFSSPRSYAPGLGDDSVEEIIAWRFTRTNCVRRAFGPRRPSIWEPEAARLPHEFAAGAPVPDQPARM
jgi:hypothetical protein